MANHKNVSDMGIKNYLSSRLKVTFEVGSRNHQQ